MLNTSNAATYISMYAAVVTAPSFICNTHKAIVSPGQFFYDQGLKRINTRPESYKLWHLVKTSLFLPLFKDLWCKNSKHEHITSEVCHFHSHFLVVKSFN